MKADEDKLRVAYMVRTFNVGGLERCIARLANYLDRERFEPMVICLRKSGSAADWLERDDVPILELNQRDGNDPFALRRLAQMLREQRVDIVHSHNWGTLVETAIARSWADVPAHVHTEHGQGLHAEQKGLKKKLRTTVERWAFDRASQIVICAESVRPLIHRRNGFPKERMLFIPNGVEDPAQVPVAVPPAELRQQLGIPADAIVVGSLGRLAEVKGFATAVEAVAMLREREQNVHLVLVGDGPEEQNLRSLAGQLGIAAYVHLPGRQSQVADWLRMFDVYVNSSRSEAMSMGILEAMAAGIPILATDVGDNRLLVDGAPACGLVTPAGNASSMAAQLERFVNDSPLRASFGVAGRDRYLQHYSIATMASQHAELYLHHSSGVAPELAAAAQ
ncbi:glycosyltransferase [Maioricimonas rarisocia]|uniref:glycosyltransferase n=1 Tax=Maioricimonas rarisocia TaxID=2528026 RepID=UPI0018D2105B|nr:glycosyltransferase [Maioricimonas rarisocia]